MSEGKVPRIRFPGFADPWEQRKLGDQMYIKSRIGWQALTRDEYLETGDYYLITGTDIDESSHTVDLKRCFYVSKERYEMDDKIQIREGDIIVTKDGTIGKVAMVTGLDKPATLNSHLFVLRDLSGNLDNRYLLQMLNSHIFDAFVNSTKTGSTLTGLPQKTIVEFLFPVPNYEEQKLISGFFDNLDNLITLHQRKCDKWKELKKSMLQKMFPKEGESVPEIRFPGFSDHWIKIKLSDIGIATSGTAIESEFSEDGSYKVISIGSYSEDSTYRDQGIRALDSEKTRKRILYKDDLTMLLNDKTSEGNIIGRVLLIDEDEKYVYNQRTQRIEVDKDKYDPVFLYEMLNAPNIREKIIKQSQGNTQIYVNWSVISQLDYLVPCKEEQIAIGSFFSMISHYIMLLQNQLDKWTELKKGLLQQMFVA